MKKTNNKGFSLVELIVVIAIMAVLIGVLAPALIGNIEKSRESKDIQALDAVYAAVKTAYGDEAGNKSAAEIEGLTEGKGVKLDTIKVTEDNAFAKQVKEYLEGEDIEFSSGANEKADVYVMIIDGNITVYAAEKAGTPTQAKKTTNEKGEGIKFLVGNKANVGEAEEPAEP
ncbi:MAG: type II secretion system protein [Clostridiales bacterium]|nr:type II secretion system protein [Clostridiales bacterium]